MSIVDAISNLMTYCNVCDNVRTYFFDRKDDRTMVYVCERCSRSIIQINLKRTKVKRNCVHCGLSLRDIIKYNKKCLSVPSSIIKNGMITLHHEFDKEEEQ